MDRTLPIDAPVYAPPYRDPRLGRFWRMFDEWMAELDASRGPVPLPFSDEYFDRVMAARDLLGRRFTIPYRAARDAGDTAEMEFLEALVTAVHRAAREESSNG